MWFKGGFTSQFAISFCTFVLIISLLACNSGDLLSKKVTATLTPTFELAQYATSTTTSILTPTTAPTRTATKPSTTSQPADSPKITAASLPNSPTPKNTPAHKPTNPSVATTVAITIATAVATNTTTATVMPTIIDTVTPKPSVPATPQPLTGRIAFPVDDGGGHYDLWVIELPAGEPYLLQSRASQPNFSATGQLLLNLKESDLGESIALLNANYTWQGILNQSPEDSYPFWHPQETHYVYSNNNLVLDPDTAHLAPYIFMPCSLQIPKFEPEIKCQDVRFGAKVVLGEAPVWTDNDQLVFYSYKGEDGLYLVENASAFLDTEWVDPPQLLVLSNGFPTDTAGDQLYFSAGNIDGNWEAYSIDLDGENLANLSQSPQSQDGLPTVSPDGQWVAFVSDRDGPWGIWVVPHTAGRPNGEPRKVVDLSTINTRPSPWGTEQDRRAWLTERISWGP